MEVKIWVLTGVVTALATLLLVVFKMSLQRIIARLDKLIDEVRELTKNTGVHRKEIDQLIERNQQQDERLNGHSQRIRNLEIKQKA